jgi:hypothetical protein
MMPPPLIVPFLIKAPEGSRRAITHVIPYPNDTCDTKMIRGSPIFSVSNGDDDDHGMMAAEITR